MIIIGMRPWVRAQIVYSAINVRIFSSRVNLLTIPICVIELFPLLIDSAPQTFFSNLLVNFLGNSRFFIQPRIWPVDLFFGHWKLLQVDCRHQLIFPRIFSSCFVLLSTRSCHRVPKAEAQVKRSSQTSIPLLTVLARQDIRKHHTTACLLVSWTSEVRFQFSNSLRALPLCRYIRAWANSLNAGHIHYSVRLQIVSHTRIIKLIFMSEIVTIHLPVVASSTRAVKQTVHFFPSTRTDTSIHNSVATETCGLLYFTDSS